MKYLKPIRSFRFSLKWLLVFVFIAAVMTSVATRVGMVSARFEITLNQLELGENGRISGRLGYRYSRVASETTAYFDFVCAIKNLDRPELLDLKPGRQFDVRYRLYDVGPLKKQNVYGLFLTETLHIEKDFYVGYVNVGNWTEIVIDGDQ